MTQRKVRWVLDPLMVSQTVHSRKLPAAVTACGQELVMADYNDSNKSWSVPNLAQDVPTVFWGPYRFIQLHSQEHVPGSFGVQTDRTRVSHYMTHLPREWFLNSQALMTTWGDFGNRTAYWLGMSGGPAFIRPDTGRKAFAGLVVTHDTVRTEINALTQIHRLEPELLMWVARAKDIQGEFRFVVAEGQVVAGSEYRWDGRQDVRSDYPQECWELAQQVAQHPWQVDRAYTVDVCLTANGPRVVELNGFSSAGLYACDPEEVVRAVSASALLEWRSIFEI